MLMQKAQLQRECWYIQLVSKLKSNVVTFNIKCFEPAAQTQGCVQCWQVNSKLYSGMERCVWWAVSCRAVYGGQACMYPLEEVSWVSITWRPFLAHAATLRTCISNESRHAMVLVSTLLTNTLLALCCLAGSSWFWNIQKCYWLWPMMNTLIHVAKHPHSCGQANRLRLSDLFTNNMWGAWTAT